MKESKDSVRRGPPSGVGMFVAGMYLLFGKKTGPGNRRFPQKTIGWGQFEPPREGKKFGFWGSPKAGSPREIGPPRAPRNPEQAGSDTDHHKVAGHLLRGFADAAVGAR